MISRNILLSAYACEPHKGSEPGVGWNWATELARLGHHVWVITRANNRNAIEEALAQRPYSNLHFVYYDLPLWTSRWKKASQGIHIYYLLWQWGAFRAAKALSKNIKFDWAHHVTFVSARQPSFMGLLGIPFFFGPVAGGETAPWRLRKSYPLRGVLRDLSRDILNFWVKFDPLMNLTFMKARRIFVTTRETKLLLPKRFRNRSNIMLAIGVDDFSLSFSRNRKVSERNNIRFLFVGQLVYLKGLHLGLMAFARLLADVPNATFTIIGSGRDSFWLSKLAWKLGIQDSVEWIRWIKRDDLLRLYGEHDIMVFPSLHDSGGMVVLEAMASSLPVVCLDLGGPGLMVDKTCGRVVKTCTKTETQIVAELTEALINLSNDKSLRSLLSRGALLRANTCSWALKVMEVLRYIEEMELNDCEERK